MSANQLENAGHIGTIIVIKYVITNTENSPKTPFNAPPSNLFNPPIIGKSSSLEKILPKILQIIPAIIDNRIKEKECYL